MQTEDAAPPASRQEIDPLLAHLPIAALVVRQARVVAANERTCALLGCRLAELLEAQDAIHAFVADGDGDRVFARHLSRIAGRPEPEEYDLDLRSRDGTRIPARARIAPFAPAGPGAFLVLLSDERARARSAELIRAFVDVAVSAQRETTRDGVFHLVRDRLAVAGLTLNVSAVKDGAFEVIALGAPPHAGILAMRERWPGGIPLDAFREVLPTPDSIHGSFIEDLPGLVARAVGKDRSELAPRMPPTAMFCYVPVDGATQYALSATGPGIDTTAASAFGLLGQHLGATLEMLRRLDELARSNGELALLLELGHDALGNLDLSRVLHAGARTAVRILRCSAAYIYLPDPNGTALQLAAVEDPETPTRTELGFTLPLGMPSLTGLAFSSREAQAAPNAETDERIHPSIVKRFGSHSVLSVPLLAHDVPRGVLTLMSRDERSFGPQDVRVAKHVAQLLSAAVAGTELFERERHRADELALVQELSGAISGKLDPAELLETAGARLLTLVEADLAAVYEQNGAAGELRLSWTRAKAGTAHALPARLAAPPVHGPATQLEEAVLRSASIRTPAGLQPLRRCGAVRLPGGRGVLGALCVARVTDNDFTPDELRILDAIGAQLSVAMENARLYAEQRARAEEMTLLNDVSRSFAGAIEMKPLLLAAGQTLRKLVGANNWFILLRDKSGKVLRAAACSPEHEEFMRRIELPLDQPSLSAQVVLQRRAIQAQQPLLAEIGSRRLIDYFHPCAVLAVPLIARDEVLGVVVLDDTERARVFSEAEMERTTGVCQQIALALLSARLYEDLRESYAELARAQAELVERERLAALGEMAASVAHEVRNPLGVIFNSVGGLRRLLQPSGDVRLLLDMVAEEADRLNRMVGDLLEYSRPLRPAVQAVSVQQVIDEAIASVLPARRQSRIEVRISVEPGLEPVSADARLLRQAIVNLVTNSVQAMPQGGVLTISAARVLSDGAAQVRIAVHDTGTGIPPEVGAKVFQPFFTTKPTGTGLGLAVVKRIAEGQGGRVQLADCERGTEFHLFLPLSG